jgi:hypothetical protein
MGDEMGEDFGDEMTQAFESEGESGHAMDESDSV